MNWTKKRDWETGYHVSYPRTDYALTGKTCLQAGLYNGDATTSATGRVGSVKVASVYE